METAARLKPELMGQSVAATGRYAIGGGVFQRLVDETQPAPNLKPAWQLRIVPDDQYNAYASPDGTVYVESGLAFLAGQSTGLWAAILSHEIAHVLRRDWARRYLYQKKLESSAGSIVLGDPGLPSASWMDSDKASAELGQFCRQMELDADREGLMLMARAGYHPDFVPALHHLLHARGGRNSASLYAMHPCWEERDRELSGAYTEASIAFAQRWPQWYASPGGNPPVLVFADPPSIRKTGAEWELRVPIHCQNLAGAVEVVLRADPKREANMHTGELSGSEDSDMRQLTGCTSPHTTVVFAMGELTAKRQPSPQWTDVYLIDAWGSVLGRLDLPKLPH